VRVSSGSAVEGGAEAVGSRGAEAVSLDVSVIPAISVSASLSFVARPHSLDRFFF